MEAKEALAAELDALRQEHAGLVEFKTKVENKDKSETQIWQDRQKQWQKADEAAKSQLSEAQKALEAKDAELSEYRMKVELNRLIGDDAINREMALMWAKAKLPGLSVNKEGVLVFVEPTGVEHEGRAAEKVFSDWWAQQTDLRRPNTAGPATRGAPIAPHRQDAPDVFVADPNMSMMERLKAAEDFDQKRRGK